MTGAAGAPALADVRTSSRALFTWPGSPLRRRLMASAGSGTTRGASAAGPLGAGLGLASAVAALPVQRSKAVGTATRRALA